MKRLKIGSCVEVKQINGETRRGYIQSEPLEFLAHIGNFYHVGDHPPAPDPETVYHRGRPRAGEIRKPRRIIYHEFGMYETDQIRVIRGRPRKEKI